MINSTSAWRLVQAIGRRKPAVAASSAVRLAWPISLPGRRSLALRSLFAADVGLCWECRVAKMRVTRASLCRPRFSRPRPMKRCVDLRKCHCRLVPVRWSSKSISLLATQSSTTFEPASTVTARAGVPREVCRSARPAHSIGHLSCCSCRCIHQLHRLTGGMRHACRV